VIRVVEPDDVDRPVVAVDGKARREWLQAADVVVGRHRSRRSARRWVAGVWRRFPGCTVALSWHPSARRCVVGFRDHPYVVSVSGCHATDDSSAGRLGRIAFTAWVRRRSASRPPTATGREESRP
jgi:hypothetical protein